MSRLQAALACIALVLAGSSSSLLAAPESASPKVRVELLSEVRAIAPGETFWVALHQRITPGWHTYWMNPGDSGEPPRIVIVEMLREADGDPR